MCNERRAFHSSVCPDSSRAVSTAEAPCSRQMRPTLSARAGTSEASPSTSMSSRAPVAWDGTSPRASRQAASMNSMAEGCTLAPSTASTARAAVSMSGKEAAIRPRVSGRGMSLHTASVTTPRVPLAAHEQLREAVAHHVLEAFGARAHDLARGQDHLQAEDGMLGHAVLDGRACPRRFRRYCRPTVENPALAGVRGEEQAMGPGGLVELGRDHAGLDHGQEIGRVDLQDAVHAVQGQDHAAGRADGPAREARTGPARRDRAAVLVGQGQDGGHLGRGLGQEHGLGAAGEVARVHGVGQALLQVGQEDGPDRAGPAVVHGAWRPWLSDSPGRTGGQCKGPEAQTPGPVDKLISRRLTYSDNFAGIRYGVPLIRIRVPLIHFISLISKIITCYICCISWPLTSERRVG